MRCDADDLCSDLDLAGNCTIGILYSGFGTRSPQPALFSSKRERVAIPEETVGHTRDQLLTPEVLRFAEF